MAGFWHLSHHQLRDLNGEILANARAYFTSAESLDPLIVYQDYGLGTEHPNPVVANAYGVFPPVFLDEADEFYRQRITNASGVLIPGTDVGTMAIVGPSSSSGGGSEVPVDSAAIASTGDVKWRAGTGTLTGWVRLNGRTMGSASSGATEEASSDTEACYIYLWENFSDAICPVTGGRGISGAVDFAADKPIALLDMRSRGMFGLDDMGNSALSAFTGITFADGDATTAGAAGGAATQTLTTAKIPSHTHVLTDPGHDHTVYASVNASSSASNVRSVQPTTGAGDVSTSSDVTGITIANTGGGEAFDKMSPFMLGTFYMKL
jgi:Microcystin-dependent protein